MTIFIYCVYFALILAFSGREIHLLDYFHSILRIKQILPSTAAFKFESH